MKWRRRAGQGERADPQPRYSMVLLDEINIALRYDYLSLEEVLAFAKGKPPQTHVVLTGRNAKEALIEMADLVTEMTLIKHPSRSGIKAQKGVEVAPCRGPALRLPSDAGQPHPRGIFSV
ncbi:MAG: cob(I)yrinic acid a,c-diamide adenosyltransferase [Cypionkella sp.]|nr:cob(I)yrinic acid a,c-diamide adenosyltransferase [Cypionkella sp.]